MAEGKRTRRTKAEVIADKIAKTKATRQKYEEKIAELDEQIEELENELNEQRADEVLAVISQQGLSIDEAIEKLKS